MERFVHTVVFGNTKLSSERDRIIIRVHVGIAR